MDFKKSFSLNLSSETAEKNTVVYGRVRVSVLTERLYRVEYSQKRRVYGLRHAKGLEQEF